MNISELIKMQRAFDENHGFNPQIGNEKELFELISKDLIGLVGEIGEFANLCKKVNFQIDHIQQINTEEVIQKKQLMKEELVDIWIYFIRICNYLKVDFETEYLKKLEINKTKFEKFTK